MLGRIGFALVPWKARTCSTSAVSSLLETTCRSMPKANSMFDGDTLAFVEVRTRLVVKDKFALPELSSTPEKHETLIRTGHYFLRERPIKECPLRFDVVAIDNTPGQPPFFDCTSPLSVSLPHRHSDW